MYVYVGTVLVEQVSRTLARKMAASENMRYEQWRRGSQVGAGKQYAKGPLLARSVRWGEESATNKNTM